MDVLEEEIGGTWKVSGQRCLPLRIIGECVKAGRRGRRPLRTSYKLCGETGDVGIVPYGGDKGEKEPSDFGF